MLFRSAIECGVFACFESSTPWFALKYDVVKSTVFFRCAVMVASWNETSKPFAPGANSLAHGVYCHFGVRCSRFATAAARSTSYPLGLM